MLPIRLVHLIVCPLHIALTAAAVSTRLMLGRVYCIAAGTRALDVLVEVLVDPVEGVASRIALT